MKRALAANAGWISAIQLGQRVIELGFTAVLARLLNPTDFGVVAAAMIVVQLAQLMVELGIGATLVQIPDLTERDVRAGVTIVGFNAIVYAVATVILAPIAASMFSLDALAAVLRVLGLMFLIQAIGVVPEALLIRRLEARRVVVARFGAKLIGTGVVGVGLALLGYGYWALIAATLVESAVAATWLWLLVRPSMRLLLDRQALMRLLRRGSGFSTSRLLNFAALRGDNALVGHYLNATALGLYARAYNLMNIPADLYGTIAERLIFPALASVQNDPQRLRRAYLQGLELTALFGLPISVMLYILAPEIISI
ncbi:MAG: lipopolysaccharide biosynthesis protein, partial [Oxalobacteraceae bacterium]